MGESFTRTLVEVIHDVLDECAQLIGDGVSM